MPELPEVETVRRGLAGVVQGRTITEVDVRSLRSVRRQGPSPQSFGELVLGATVSGVARRGKYLWWSLDGAPVPALVAHLGMSGQFRSGAQHDACFGPHERVRFVLDDDSVISFVDQRTFGWLLADRTDLAGVPESVAHIGLDPFDPAYDLKAAVTRLLSRRTEVKRALLDQTLVSGIGNIYADEALWTARVHPRRSTQSLSRRAATSVLVAAADVMGAALRSGGTSFDPLYVDVNGERGWFGRDLAVYRRAGWPCPRCGTPIVRERFINRSSHRCPRCQRR